MVSHTFKLLSSILFYNNSSPNPPPLGRGGGADIANFFLGSRLGLACVLQWLELGPD